MKIINDGPILASVMELVVVTGITKSGEVAVMIGAGKLTFKVNRAMVGNGPFKGKVFEVVVEEQVGSYGVIQGTCTKTIAQFVVSDSFALASGHTYQEEEEVVSALDKFKDKYIVADEKLRTILNKYKGYSSVTAVKLFSDYEVALELSTGNGVVNIEITPGTYEVTSVRRGIDVTYNVETDHFQYYKFKGDIKLNLEWLELFV